MIGKVCLATTPYYDKAQQRNSFKVRPVLVISGQRNNDYTALPISRITMQANIDHEYDVKVDPAQYPRLGLNNVSYIRAHKQIAIHRSELTKQIGDMTVDYPDLFVEIIGLVEKWNIELINKALDTI